MRCLTYASCRRSSQASSPLPCGQTPPRLGFAVQPITDVLTTSVDTDFAGCVAMRRSTSGGITQRGSRLLKHWSNTQLPVALSSAEAELGGICRGASTTMGLKSIASDLGFWWSIVIRTDATAAIGICRRRGLRKIRHLAAADLWVQDRLRSKDFDLVRNPSEENPSDVLTKYVARPLMHKHLVNMGGGVRFEEGRAGAAPTIDHTINSFL